MSNNSKIEQISNAIFYSNPEYLRNKNKKEILKEKEEFEYQLETSIIGLDNKKRKDLLNTLARECERKGASFFDHKGNINITKVKGFIKEKIEEIEKEDGRTQTNIDGKGVRSQENYSRGNNFQISEASMSKVQNILEEYEELSSDDEKYRFIKDKFGIDEKKQPDLANMVKKQMDYTKFVQGMRKKGTTEKEIEESIKAKPEFNELTSKQKKLVNGQTKFSIQLGLEQDIVAIKSDIESIEAGISFGYDSIEKRINQEEVLERLRKQLEEKKREHDEIARDTGIEYIDQSQYIKNDEFNKEANKGGEEFLKNIEALDSQSEKKDNELDIELIEIKNLEDFNELMKKGVFKEGIKRAVGIFSDALNHLGEGTSKKELEEMITEMQEGTSPEVIAILDVLPNMEFDRDLDEILSSDEYIMELVGQLSECLENLQEKEVESKEQQEEVPVTTEEFNKGSFKKEEMIVAEQDRSQEENKLSGIVNNYQESSKKEVKTRSRTKQCRR